MYRVMTDCGVDVDRAWPWARPWMARYQMDDGGWNCDEAAYLREARRSSFVSTVPVLEALVHAVRDRSAEEDAMLDRGAEYLIARRLCRSLSRGGALADPDWLRPIFPRFYEYDVLRGLEFLAAWSRLRRRALPPEAIEDAQAAIRDLHVRDFTAVTKSRTWDGRAWQRGVPSSSFPLLEAARVHAPEILARTASVLEGDIRAT